MTTHRRRMLQSTHTTGGQLVQHQGRLSSCQCVTRCMLWTLDQQQNKTVTLTDSINNNITDSNSDNNTDSTSYLGASS